MNVSRKMKGIAAFVCMSAAATAISAGSVQHGGAPVSLAARFKDVSSSHGGTWADETGRSLLVVTCPNVCWMLKNGQWRIGGINANGGAYTSVEVGSERYVLCKPEHWRREKLRKIGFVVEEGSWYFGKEPTLFRTRRWGEKLPDEKAASEILLRKVTKVSNDAIQDGTSFNVGDYVGVWKFGSFLGSKNVDNKRYISIRKDGSGCVFVSDKETAVPCGEIRWTAEMGGIRCMDCGEKPYYANEATDAYYIWFDAEKDCLVANRWNNWGEMKRVKGVSDPALVCRKMMCSRKYSGCWSGGEMFNAFTIAFDSDGTGFFTGFRLASPFKWTADADGNIGLKLPLPYGDVTNMVARYDYATDTMSVMGQRRGRRNTTIKSDSPARDMYEALSKRVEEGMAERRKKLLEFENQYERKSEELAFADMESMLAWLKNVDHASEETRTVMVNTPAPQLFDSVAYSAKDGWTASLGVGYFERGERPSETEVSALRWNGCMRPRGLPKPQIECRDGIDELRIKCNGYGIVDISDWTRQKMTQWWFCCCDVLNVRGVPKEKIDAFSDVLRTRFSGRFPCKVTASTITRKVMP